MDPKDVTRKLSAILSADVQGYSRLMGDDERATVETITAYRKVMTDLIQEHHGRVVDAKGDNVLAEFSSVVDAIQCAVEIQKELKVKNADLPEHRRMEFRIGVNLGDVIEMENTIYGDGVNIAARLESLAEGGGICISGTAFDQVGKKLPLGYEYLGEQAVKNIEKPIRVYKVLVDPQAVGKVIGEKARLKTWHWTAIFGFAMLVLVVGVLALWEFYVRPDVAPASVENMAYPLPDKPSIAVMPFENLSGDPKQEYLCNGMTKDIITGLSYVPKLFVIALNSTTAYKGAPIKTRQVSEKLGVRYVLEGSVQDSGDRVRITVQLIDAITGKYIWVERYDREPKNIFAIQDEITKRVITTLQVKLTEGEQARMWAEETPNLEAYLKALEAYGYVIRGNNTLARKTAREALALDPINLRCPYRTMAISYINDVWSGSSKSPKESLDRAEELAQKALAMDDTEAATHALMCGIYTMKRQYEKAIAEGERAIVLNPNSAEANFMLAEVLRYSGRLEEAITLCEKAIRLNPIPPVFYLTSLAASYTTTGRYEEAITLLKRALRRVPNNLHAHLGLAGIYSILGSEQDARAEAAEVLKIDPKFSLKKFAKIIPSKNQDGLKRYIEALRKAGLK